MGIVDKRPVGIFVRDALGADGTGVGVHLIHLMSDHRAVGAVKRDHVAGLQRCRVGFMDVDHGAYRKLWLHGARKHGVGRVAEKTRKQKGNGKRHRSYNEKRLDSVHKTSCYAFRHIAPPFLAQVDYCQPEIR